MAHQLTALGLSFPPPALGECRHRLLARPGITVRGCAILVVAEGERPRP
jgi:hypothetical protein